ncbi:L-2-hydroxyglutarate dehydrogenase, mitochondrial-like [Dorcoceras hygrometricum]|uniref:L-2-hydroxyglutarate dehydrogenase, mitochondrial-like n=1 Tax=Dorcoceras hygrometricum TaxID=472368 RepID=A0A2Z6ZRR6_9LAMI|nr:L-2-hydroxyglutarate dehydrogenase, mitochondrial-like [Dorcoceras hygrometricum]
MLRVDGRTLGAAACEEIGHWIARDCATGCRKAAPLHARCVRDCCTAQRNRCAVVRCWPADELTRLCAAGREIVARWCARCRREFFVVAAPPSSAAAPAMLRRVSGDVVTAGLISSRV